MVGATLVNTCLVVSGILLCFAKGRDAGRDKDIIPGEELLDVGCIDSVSIIGGEYLCEDRP